MLPQNIVKRAKPLKILIMIVTIIIGIMGSRLLMVWYGAYVVYYHDIKFMKSFFITTINKNVPPKYWKALLGTRLRENPDEAFYFFKIWFIEAGVSEYDLRFPYPISAFKDDERTRLDFFYGRHQPIIQCLIYHDNQRRIIDAYFPLNNCLFDPDYNNDGIVNMQDVKLAQQRKESWTNNVSQ
jgi:hypothetical protein